MIDNCKKSNINISQRLYIINERKIISYFVFCRKANDNYLLYHEK